MKKIILAVEMLVAVFMFLVVKTIAPVCGGMLELASGKMVHMKCHYAAVVFTFIAVVLLINALIAMFAKPSVVSGIMTVVIAALVYVTLNDAIGIGICANAEMACQMTAPYVKIAAMLEMICGIVYSVSASKNKE